MIKEIKNLTTIEEVVRFYGFNIRNKRFICPFHDDTRPSAVFSEKLNMFKCFSCGSGGDAIQFVAKLHKIKQIEAAEKINVDLNLNLSKNEKKNKKAIKCNSILKIKKNILEEKFESVLKLYKRFESVDAAYSNFLENKLLELIELEVF